MLNGKMDIKSRGGNIIVSQEDLNSAKVNISVKKMGSKTVTQGMNRSRLGNTGLCFGYLKDMLNISGSYRSI